MSLTIQTAISGAVTVEPAGFNDAVAVLIGGQRFFLSAVEAESLALALQATTHEAMNPPVSNVVYETVEEQPSRGFLISAMGTRTASHVGRSKADLFDSMMAAF